MSLRARLVAALAYVLVLVIVALTVPLGLSVRDRVESEVRSQARSQAEVVAALAADPLARGSRARLRSLVATAARQTRGRVVVIDPAGIAVADSAGRAGEGRTFSTRPEVAGALAGRATQDERASETLGEELLATAVPIVEGTRRTGAVRITQSVAAVDRSVRRSWTGLAVLGLLVLAFGLLAGAVLAGGLAAPLRRLRAVAMRVARGDLTARAEVEGPLEQREVAEAFNDMTERLARMVQSQQEFVADASHQLRTPLAGLRLRIEEARAATGDPEAIADLDAALGEADRLAGIVGDLLEVSRAGSREARPRTLALADVAGRTRERWAAAAVQRGHSVTGTDDGAAVTGWCPPEDLERVLDALVENALRYSPEGSTVTIAAVEDTITVADEGPGLAPDEEEAVFGRFHRGSAGRGGPRGTGLGLAISRGARPSLGR